ncbi:MAG TPA: hypothetical protein DHU56_04115 [Marinobacter sp.]|jgi:hypothetical protein|nr:hypothetical protein [Marinobacter sp.]
MQPFHSAFLFIAALLSFLLLTAGPVAAADHSKSYTLWYRNYDSGAVRSLLELALNKTPEYGDYRLLRSDEMAQGRALRELARKESGSLDIATVATTLEREQQLNAVPVPIDGGLLGFRVCVTTPEKLERFEGIASLEDLRNRGIVIGQGAHWPDTPILEAAGIPVVTHSRYEVLFGMLEKGRFDCFARGVSEVLYDLERHANKDLVIEPDLLIAYPMPSYFFTAPDDHETAQRIQLGLERAIKDGSFAVFLQTWYGRPVKELHLNRRITIELPNPYLPEESAIIGRRTLDALRQRIDTSIRLSDL